MIFKIEIVFMIKVLVSVKLLLKSVIADETKDPLRISGVVCHLGLFVNNRHYYI